MKKNQAKRQGDVVLMKVGTLPSNVILRKMTQKLSTIVARGENSNHCHAVVGDEIDVYDDGNGDIYVNAKGEFELKHLLESELLQGKEIWTTEHTPLKFDKGTYKFIGQVEWHPYLDEIRKVKD